MTLLKDISIMWSLIHTLILFMLLFESRYSKKKTLTITLTTMIPLIIVNFILFVSMGFNRYGSLMLLTLSLPSLIVFWFLSKHRDGRFFFTFCMVDTVVLEIVYVTNILNHYTTPDTYIVMFALRLLAYPLLELFAYKKLRPMFLDVQKHNKKGWGIFAVIGALFYLAITLLMTYPTPILERTEYIPALAIMFLLMPVIYLHIIMTLRHLQKKNEATVDENILKLQVSNLTARMDELAAADDKFRMERHNLRHKLKTFATLIKTEQYDECLTLLAEYSEALDKTRVKRYCQHTVLDAVLSSYIQRANDKGITLDMGLSFPDVIPMSETELATAIANALENAINACEKLEPEQRFIEIKVLDHPGFIIRIVNSFDGIVEFDEDDIPINHDRDHGFGTRFIAAFCQKNNGFCEFKASENIFTLYLNF